MKGERVHSTPNSCSATNCGTRILAAKAVLESETAPTPNLFQNQLSTSMMDSVCNSHFPGTKSPLSLSKLLPDLLKESIEPRSAKHGLQDFISVDPPTFNTWLPGGSAKTRPAGHRRGRPPRTSGEHSWQTLKSTQNSAAIPGEPQWRITTPLYSTIMLDNSQRISQRLVTDTLQRDVFFRAVISVTLFQL